MLACLLPAIDAPRHCCSFVNFASGVCCDCSWKVPSLHCICMPMGQQMPGCPKFESKSLQGFLCDSSDTIPCGSHYHGTTLASAHLQLLLLHFLMRNALQQLALHTTSLPSRCRNAMLACRSIFISFCCYVCCPGPARCYRLVSHTFHMAANKAQQ